MNHYFRALAFAPLLALSLPPLWARPAICQPLPDRAPLTGVVVNAKGAPVAGALLSIRRSNPNLSVAFWGATTASDDAGNFSFPDAEEGDYAFTVEAPGYAVISYFEAKWRVGAAPVRITMDRLLDVTLNVRAPDGSPVADAPVYLRLRQEDASTEKPINARTDAGGQLRVPGITPGVYALYLSAPQGFASLFDLNVAEPIAPTRDVTLQPGGALKLTLTDELGRALGGATLSLSPATIEESRRLFGFEGGPGEDFALLAARNNRNLLVSRDGDGTIELDNLPPGVYSPRVALPGYRFDNLQPITISTSARAELKLSAPSRRARTLTLQLRTPDDKPYVAGEVSLRVLPLAANGQMGGDPPPNPDDADDLPFFPSGPGGRRVLPDAKGQVTLFPVKAGHYRIFAAPQIKDPAKNPPEATPVDVTIGASGATATVVVPGS